MHNSARESPPTPELKNLWNQLQFLEAGVRVLENEALVSRWAWLLGSALFGFVYVYIAFLFAFGYYGVARAVGVPLGWTDCFVTSLFIPFLVSSLPSAVSLKLVAGFHCLLIVGVGAGTILKYLRSRFESIRTVGTIIGVRLSDDGIREKYLILEQKVAPTAESSSAPR